MRVKLQEDHLNPNQYPLLLTKRFERPPIPESQPDPSPRPSPSIPIPDPIQRVLVGIMEVVYPREKSLSGDEVTIQAKEIKDLKAQLKKLKKKARPLDAGKRRIQTGSKTSKSKPRTQDQTFDVAFADLDAMITWRQLRMLTMKNGVSTEDQLVVNPDEEEAESETESEGVNEAERSLLRVANDEREYLKGKRSDENFIAIGSAEDERIIKDVNKKATGTKKDDSIKEERKEEETPDKDKEVDYEILDKKYPIIEWKSKHLGIKPQYDEAKDLEEINLNVVIRSSGQRRYFSTLVKVLSIFDRDDLNVVYQLVIDIYKDEVPEGFDRVLLGDLMIMFNPIDEDEFWNSQQDWNVYPLRKKVLVQMLELKLESEEDNTMAWELIRFVKKLITELEPVNSDGNEKDL
ncbi:hypothetical protein Tco_0939054 [Tanacetum coccineum]|uniref:Uncharacterized protein n=1 Tax=Tanacetum coccineum TaxID=301880 RepID=A0ABQ5DQW5_9ASTR